MLSPHELRRQLDVEPFQVHSPIKELISALSDHRNPQTRQAAALALGRIGGSHSDGRQAVKPLLAILQDPVETVRIAAVTALGQIGAPQAVPSILPFLKQASVLERRCAAEALGKIGAPQAVEPLIGALRDDSHRVCLAALKALGHIGDRRAMEALVAVLGDGDICTRLAAAAALIEIAGASRAHARSRTDKLRAPLS